MPNDSKANLKLMLAAPSTGESPCSLEPTQHCKNTRLRSPPADALRGGTFSVSPLRCTSRLRLQKRELLAPRPAAAAAEPPLNAAGEDAARSWLLLGAGACTEQGRLATNIDVLQMFDLSQ